VLYNLLVRVLKVLLNVFFETAKVFVRIWIRTERCAAWSCVRHGEQDRHVGKIPTFALYSGLGRLGRSTVIPSLSAASTHCETNDVYRVIGVIAVGGAETSLNNKS
jgi:hypothetical protein